MNVDLELYLNSIGVEFHKNVDLKKKTWIHRGGMCEFFILPDGREQLLLVSKYLYKEHIRFVLFGHTSNIYVLNTCDLPVVVSTLKCNHFELTDEGICCEAGVGVIKLANHMVRNGIAGFEYLTDLPGTVGAAIYNNSSCKSNSISDLMISVEVLLKDGSIVVYDRSDLDFRYRSSAFKRGDIEGVILGAVLKAEPGNASLLMEAASKNIAERQTLLDHRSKSLGSTMNSCFSNGHMPLRYYILFRLYNLWLRIVDRDSSSRQSRSKVFLCKIAGYGNITKYISDQDVIIFNWLDDEADDAFPLYLEFMSKVFRTDKVEIEIIK